MIFPTLHHSDLFEGQRSR